MNVFKKISLLLIIILLLMIIAYKIIAAYQERNYQSVVKSLLTPTTIQPNTSNNTAILPLYVDKQPITQLALINFEQNPEAVYNALEIQFLERVDASGYRILAYRNDGFVDVYDDVNLPIDLNESFEVAGKGANAHVSRDLGQVIFEKDDQGNVTIAFSFIDLLNRPIEVAIKEGIDKPSTPLNLLAPIGVGSEKPSYFPLFWLYDFDFIRTSQLTCDINIDGNAISPDPFPVPFPIDGQLRNFIRYSFDARLYSLFDVNKGTLRKVTLNEQNQWIENDVVYQFDEQNQLTFINHQTTAIVFEPSLNLSQSHKGQINVVTQDNMGYIQGSYQVTVMNDGKTHLTFHFDDGWKANVPLLMHKIIVNDNSVFASWPKQYYFDLTIDWQANTLEGKWENRQ
ncbi:hypothetical protein [Fundicoccus culcitae]|uniref:Regulatory protein YycH domain-containing protein n=1 Tax=Fundicoccus culcitae TaxID=2969821 RepID=A0ABY5P8M1_9LACT|nr:hypothetical protein [Fundicoccus culcitae]UUX34936.1 hypothetical protein NRE15_04630 [Fundicoccus culcitae]